MLFTAIIDGPIAGKAAYVEVDVCAADSIAAYSIAETIAAEDGFCVSDTCIDLMPADAEWGACYY